MAIYVLDGIPIPWKAHGGAGRRSFNPLYKERQYYQWQIRAQHNREEPITSPVRLDLTFHMPIPKATSGIRKQQMLNGVMHHIKRPDVTNLQKFIEDCIKGIVIEDDAQVVEVNARKIYSETPKTILKIEFI